MNTEVSRENPVLNPIALQRLEGLAALGLSVAAYSWLDQSWLIFALLFFVPDITMVGYLRSPRLGAWIYNLGHTYVGPAILALSGILLGPTMLGLAAIWVGHIGLDRMLGYGLKLESGFQHTHLGSIGKAR